ncbi:MAG: hypothetical protein J2P25_07975 [Nocardiopsaceae bacterium]|nr:hypothetical protein [Nocardiopsaceae bacterium]
MLDGGDGVPGTEIATLTADATPYVMAAVSAYGGAVLAKTRDKAADATVSVGVRFLQRVFGHKKDGDPIPHELAVLAATPEDPDALGAVCRAIHAAMSADEAMLGEVRSILDTAPGPPVIQNVHAGGDAYAAARDMTIYQSPGQ